MGVYKTETLMSTSAVDFSSEATMGFCKGINAGDKIDSTSVGLGHITSGMMLVFHQITAGTCMAGITSGTEYMVSAVTTASSSFQVYALYGSSAVEITADSTGSDNFVKVVGGSNIQVEDADYATVQLTPTTGYDGTFTFVGSNKPNMDPDGRLTTANPYLPVAYRDIGLATSETSLVAGTTYVDSSGGLASSNMVYKVPCQGLKSLSIRTKFLIAGGLSASVNCYRN